MSEQVIRPDASREQDALLTSEQATASTEEDLQNQESSQEPSSIEEEKELLVSSEKIIWTPAFLLTFGLTLVLGLSAESLFAQGWASRLFAGQWIILAQIALATLGWLGLGVITRSPWIRVGCIFGGIWAVFMCLSTFTNVQGVAPGTPVQSYINVATCIALLGAYIGLSIEGTLLTAWDTSLFFLVPIVAAVDVTLNYFMTPQASILTVYNTLATNAIAACCLFWWLRPSCWKKHPGPTFIFGLVPVILLIAALIDTSMHDFFLLQALSPYSNPRVYTNNFFFAEVALLCVLLGCMRMAKGELPGRFWLRKTRHHRPQFGHKTDSHR